MLVDKHRIYWKAAAASAASIGRRSQPVSGAWVDLDLVVYLYMYIIESSPVERSWRLWW